MKAPAAVRRAAIGVAASHLLIALVGMFVLKAGSAPTGTVGGRAAYVAAHADAWLAAWLVPPVAGLTLVWLAVALRRRYPDDPGLGLAAHALAVGTAIEGVGCLVAAAALPALASGDAGVYRAVELVVQLATSTFGNGPFTLGVLLLTAALARGGAAASVVGLGVLAGAAGLAFAIAGTVATAVLPVANGALLGAVVLFGIAIARTSR